MTSTPPTETESSASTATARVLVVVDARMRDFAALETAAALAARMRAELEALLVEDESLADLAGLPFIQEIDRLSGAMRPWDPMRVSRMLRVQHQMLNRAVARLTETMRIATRVRVARGHYRREALAAAAKADVTFFSRPSRALASDPGASERRPGARARAGLAAAQPVWALYDGTPASTRALEIAVELAAHLRADLRVLLAGFEGSPPADQLRACVESALSHRNVPVRIMQLSAPSADEMVEIVRRYGASLLCVGRGTKLTEAESSEAALERLTCPVVVIG